MAMHLTLFFTYGVSLAEWERVGMLSREIALYRALEERGVRIRFVTYGGVRDLGYADRLGGIEVLCNRWHLPLPLYQLAVPTLYRRELAETEVIKTNQLPGAGVALRAAQRFGKPLIARCGYLWSALAARGGNRLEALRARLTEASVFRAATRTVVTTAAMRHAVRDRYGVPESRIEVIPNYVLTDLFTPASQPPGRARIACVGRLHPEKNLLALVEAFAGLDIELVLIGEGPQRAAIARRARELGVKLELTGSVPHAEVAERLRGCLAFALVSPIEGHPKALIEAMACGLPVIGADSPGIRELIEHRETGLICGGDAEGIRKAIVELVLHQQLRGRLGANAHRYALQRFDLVRIVERELAVLSEVRCGGTTPA